MKLLFRNAAIGAAFLSYRALFYREYGFFALLCGLGALSGVLYTLLEPLFRNRPRLHYLPWILCAYLAIGGTTIVGVLEHDDMSLTVLKSPWGGGVSLNCRRNCSLRCGTHVRGQDRLKGDYHLGRGLTSA